MNKQLVLLFVVFLFLFGTSRSAEAAWVQCAVEGGTCRVSGYQHSRYGAQGLYVYRDFTDSIGCSNTAFGKDPIFGVKKVCEYFTTPPSVAITSKPAMGTTQTVASIAFTVSDAGNDLKSVQCSLNNATFASCTSPVGVMTPVGAYTFVVQATDIAGNSARADHTWSVVAAPTFPGPTINNALIPKGFAGYNTVRIKTTSQLPRPTDVGAFRVSCPFSHMNYDDSIVFPGQPGRSHLHAYFGNTGANAYSTQSSLENSGNSTCDGGTANRSAYWVPAMIDTRNGRPIAPDGAGIYYKSGYNKINTQNFRVPPAGLRMIAGNSKATTEATARNIRYKCIGGPNNVNYGYKPYIVPCKVGEALLAEVFFPQCWDGVRLDSPDHKSHMSYLSSGVCPSSHPIPLPEITFNIKYTVTSTDSIAHWRLASDMYDPSLPGGYSGHGDWFNGWKPDVIQRWIKNCVQASTDCHAYLLGDGLMID